MLGGAFNRGAARETIAQAYDIPPELFARVLDVGGFDSGQVEMTRVAQSMSEAKSVGGSWERAIELFGRAEMGDVAKSDRFVDDVLNPNHKPGKEETEGGFIDRALGWVTKPVDVVKDKYLGIFGSVWMVVGGLILIVLAVMSYKPVREIAKKAITRGAAK